MCVLFCFRALDGSCKRIFPVIAAHTPVHFPQESVDCFPVHWHAGPASVIGVYRPQLDTVGMAVETGWPQLKTKSSEQVFHTTDLSSRSFSFILSAVLYLKWLIFPVQHLTDVFALKTQVLDWGTAPCIYRLLLRGIGGRKRSLLEGEENWGGPCRTAQQTSCSRKTWRSTWLSIY